MKFLQQVGSADNLLPVLIVLLAVGGWLFWSRREWQKKAIELKNEKEERQAGRIQDQQNIIEVLRREKRRQEPAPPRPQKPDSSTDRNQS